MNELVLLSVLPDGDLAYRVQAHPLAPRIAPDESVRRSIGWTKEAPLSALIHSTSWRFQDPDMVVLTWAITPDPDPQHATRWTPTGVSQGPTGTHPVPENLTISNVVAHAIRHMAFLLHTDPVVQKALHRDRALHDALLTVADPGLAGELHTEP